MPKSKFIYNAPFIILTYALCTTLDSTYCNYIFSFIFCPVTSFQTILILRFLISRTYQHFTRMINIRWHFAFFCTMTKNLLYNNVAYCFFFFFFFSLVIAHFLRYSYYCFVEAPWLIQLGEERIHTHSLF